MQQQLLRRSVACWLYFKVIDSKCAAWSPSSGSGSNDIITFDAGWARCPKRIYASFLLLFFSFRQLESVHGDCSCRSTSVCKPFILGALIGERLQLAGYFWARIQALYMPGGDSGLIRMVCKYRLVPGACFSDEKSGRLQFASCCSIGRVGERYAEVYWLNIGWPSCVVSRIISLWERRRCNSVLLMDLRGILRFTISVIA